jgi:nucleoid-associated protein YgaU
MPLEKAVITDTVTGQRIPVQFNPEEYTLAKDVNWAQIAVPGLSSPLLQFVNGNLQTLEMELLLDSYEAGGDVRELSSALTDLMRVNPTTHAPPVLLFTWASLSFTCVLARASQRFLMFLPDGTPVRVRLQVTFNEFRNAELEAREVKRETADYTSRAVVRGGDTLSAVAARAYGDPAAWRAVALRNGIDDPWDLPAGTELALPPLPYRDPETGELHP